MLCVIVYNTFYLDQSTTLSWRKLDICLCVCVFYFAQRCRRRRSRRHFVLFFILPFLLHFVNSCLFGAYYCCCFHTNLFLALRLTVTLRFNSLCSHSMYCLHIILIVFSRCLTSSFTCHILSLFPVVFDYHVGSP